MFCRPRRPFAVTKGQYDSIDLGLAGERKQLGPWILMTIRRGRTKRNLISQRSLSPWVFLLLLLFSLEAAAEPHWLPALALAFSTTIVLCALLEVFHASLLKGNLGQGFSFSFFCPTSRFRFSGARWRTSFVPQCFEQRAKWKDAPMKGENVSEWLINQIRRCLCEEASVHAAQRSEAA